MDDKETTSGSSQVEATIQKGRQREIVFLAREMKLSELAAHEWTLLTFHAKRKQRCQEVSSTVASDCLRRYVKVTRLTILFSVVL